MKEAHKPWLWVIAAVLIIGVVGVGIHIHSNSVSRKGGTGECNNNYSGYCVPNVSYDIDCKDIKHKVQVVGKDVYHFDADHDGVGCESYN